MKNLLTSAIIIMLAGSISAQAPDGITYQAVIRNADNQLITNNDVGITASIIHQSPEGTVLYSEFHSAFSNAMGLVSIIIGKGSVLNGDFAGIDWANGTHFIKTEVNVPGIITITGISEVFSIPHAFHTGSLTLTSPGGNHYKIIIDEDGNLGTVGISSGCPPSVTDYDGNVYNTVLIGDQCWMKENLKTTQYRNGTPIEYPGTNNSAWQSNTTGAYAWYANNIDWKDSYGALYNWYAVNNPNGLCPKGWHVPSDAQWTQLVDYVVAQSFPNQWDNPNGAGNALKSCRQVNSPLGGDCNTAVHPRWDEDTWSPYHHGFDEFGFSGLPGGVRSDDGNFYSIGSNGNWWSSTEYSTNNAWFRDLYYYSGDVSRDYSDKANGFSVRCVKD